MTCQLLGHFQGLLNLCFLTCRQPFWRRLAIESYFFEQMIYTCYKVGNAVLCDMNVTPNYTILEIDVCRLG